MKILRQSIILFSLFIITSYCSKTLPPTIVYKSITIENPITQFVTKEVFRIFSPVKFNNKVYFQSYPNVWVADMDKKKMKLLFKKGIGPNEIYWVNRLNLNNHEIYINSYWPLKYIYHFSPNSENLSLEKIKIPTATSFDDFFLLNPDRLIVASAQWEEGDLLRIYNLKTGQKKSIGKRTFTPIMRKFNVNIASICFLEDYIYVTQKIVPEIQVFSISNWKLIDKIKLSPPFYKSMPIKYNVKKFDRKQHIDWQGLWTSIFDISGKNDWLLVTYQTWSEQEEQYYYELINLKEPLTRFYIDKTSYLIYDFEISGKQISLDMCEEEGESIRWLKANSNLY